MRYSELTEERLDEFEIASLLGSATWWVLTNPMLVANIIGILAIVWQAATMAASAFAMYKTMRWILEAVGIMDDPEEVVKLAKDDDSYMDMLSNKIADFFKNEKDTKKIEREIKVGMTQVVAMRDKQ